MEQKQIWARVCSATGQGMNEGYLFEESLMYFIDEEDALKFAQEIGYADLDEAYDDDAYCYTEWDADDEQYHYEQQPDGTLKEIWKNEQ
jgi:hypothetical protein